MKRILALAIIILASLEAFAGNGPEVYDLRCEGLKEPLGIATSTPHFSWKIQSQVQGDCQTAYEIEVGPALWSSGMIKSSEQVMVPYGGAPLTSRTQGWWRVRVWNSEGKVSPWSETQRFGVGVIGEDRLEGSYIGAVPGEGRAPLLRKSFCLDALGTGVILQVNSLGYHDVTVNGQAVNEEILLAPAVSQLDKRSLIVTYDITPFVHKGDNEIVIAAGSGWYKPGPFGAVYDGPLVKAEIDVVHDGIGEPIVSTDASWQGAWSGWSDTGTWMAHHFAGERIDARVVPEWGPVDVVDIDGIVATPQLCGHNYKSAPHLVKEVIPAGDGKWILDFGTVMNGMVDITLPCLPSGHVTRAGYSDFMSEDGTLDIGTYDEFISSGAAEGDRFYNRFNHHVFRYIQFEGLEEAPLAEDIMAFRMEWDDWNGTYFVSSDDELNAIHDMISWTLRNLSFSGYMVDCANIERLGYGGDGNASTESLQIFADAAPLYANWLQAWNDSIKPDGGLPHTAPNPYKAGGGPYWCSFLVQAPWRTYMNYGDVRTIEMCYPEMKHWLEYVDTYSVNGLLKQWPEEPTYRWWYLGDWAAPDGVNVRDPESVDLVNNCAMCQVYLELTEIAKVLGLPDDEAEYRSRYEALKELIHKNFWHSETSTYGTGSQIDMVYPMLVGVVPDSLKAEVKRSLFERTESVYGGHLATGLVGIPVLTEWATREGECEWFYSLLKQHGYPGYLYMLDNGATGTWEHWNGRRSRLHNCFNGIGSWFYRALGGIVPDEPGYRHVTINPQIPAGLKSVEVSQDTPYGRIYVIREGESLNVEIPVGITATINGNEYKSGVYDF